MAALSRVETRSSTQQSPQGEDVLQLLPEAEEELLAIEAAAPSPELQKELILQVQAGYQAIADERSDSFRDQLLTKIRDAEERLVELNKGMVMKIAQLVSGEREPDEDLIQEGNITLLKAIRIFDFSRSNRLSTLAYRNIWRVMKTYQRKHSSVVELPNNVPPWMKPVLEERKRILDTEHREPHVQEIIENLGIRNPLHMSNIVNYWNLYQSRSSMEDLIGNENPQSESPVSFHDFMPDPQNVAYEAELNILSGMVVGMVDENTIGLTEPEKTVLMLKFAEGLDEIEIAGQLEKTPGSVGRLVKQGILKIRKGLRSTHAEYFEYDEKQ